MSSFKYTNAENYQAYVQQIANELFSKMFFGFRTAGMVTNHEGVKGKKVLTELVVGDLVKRWKSSFAASSDVIDYQPRTIETARAKMDLSVAPQELESSYLGELRRRGQSPEDWPFQAFIIEKLLMKIQQEQEIAVWQGTEKSPTADSDTLKQLFDGYLELIKDAITATTLSPVATGAIDNTNAVAKVEEMYQNLGAAYQDMPVDCFMSKANFHNYVQDYRNRYGKYTAQMTEDGDLKFDLGQMTIRGMAGMGTSGRVIITPASNLHYAMDAPNDNQLIRFQQHVRELYMWCDFRIGVQIAILDDEVIVVNDQT